MNKKLFYVLGSLCLVEAVGLAWLWPRAQRLVYSQNQAGIPQTLVMAKPGEIIIVRTSEPTFSVGVWGKGSESHVSVMRNWDNGRHYAIELWSDQAHQKIQGIYSRYLNGQMFAVQAFDEEGMPSMRVARTFSRTSAPTKYFKRGALDWDEIPRQVWIAQKQ
jgi:hypothetical protein